MGFTSHFPGKWTAVLSIAIMSSVCTIGSTADSTVTVKGKTLTLIGAGLREFLMFDIYKMAAYSESGSCAPNDIIRKNEIKTLRLFMLKDIPASRMRSTLRSTLEDALEEGKDNSALQKKIDAFLARMDRDLKTGDYVELTFLPGKGTLIKRNGKRLGGFTPGKDFADLLWASYFGKKTCCKSLKSDILGQCKKK